MHRHTPTARTAGPLSLLVIPCACKGNTTSGTDPVEKYDNPQTLLINYSTQITVEVIKLNVGNINRTHRVLSSEPISPLMEGSGCDLDDEGTGSLILSSVNGFSS